MGIRELFDSYDEAEQYMLSYEDENFRFASTNKTVADASVEVELSLFPKIFHGYIKNVLYTLCAPKLREALVRILSSLQNTNANYAYNFLLNVVRVSPILPRG